jgi:creatinine amidohydrolase
MSDDRTAVRTAAGTARPGPLISEMTWPDYHAAIADAVVILPVGSIEQHGPHLPLGTDAIQVAAIAERVGRELPGLVASTIPYGYRSGARTGGGEIFPGTTSLSGQALTLVVRDILTALLRHGARRIAVLDGHYENDMFLNEAMHLVLPAGGRTDVRIVKVLWADAIDAETLDRAWPNGFPGWALEHAAHLETSVISAIRPDLVRRDQLASGGGVSLPAYDIYPQPAGMVPRSGVLSNPSQASERDGRLLVDRAVAGLVEILRRELVQWEPEKSKATGGGDT